MIDQNLTKKTLFRQINVCNVFFDFFKTIEKYLFIIKTTTLNCRHIINERIVYKTQFNKLFEILIDNKNDKKI